ncbi:BQ2448_853 [Microbotryum intermedium]|uniref:BQ2448_853 protein n=1 Tax=Microbotryum intermedium TaxID=269621 RepID=A0A238F3N7_9BASI|nr:BQ2448_853 [Microbotryum intermedium]
MTQDVIASIFEPGTNSGLVQAMSYSFYALFVTLCGMVLLTGGNLHVVALLVLSLGLYASIRWIADAMARWGRLNHQLGLDWLTNRFLVQIKDVEDKMKLEREKEEREKKLQDGTKGKAE